MSSDNAAIAERLERVRGAARPRGLELLQRPRLPARGRADPVAARAGRGARARPGGCASCAGSGRDRGAAARARRDGRDRRAATSSSARSSRSSSPSAASSGSSPQRAVAIGRALGVADGRRAARGGRGRAARGRPGHRAEDRGEAARRARARAEPRAAARPAAEPRAGARRRRSPTRSAARSRGDPRRWRDVSSGSPSSSRRRGRSRARPLRDAAADRLGRRARRRRRASASRSRECRSRSSSRRPSASARELVRATGSRRVRRGARPTAGRARRGRRLRALGLPFVPAGAARGAVRRRAAGARRARTDPRRPARPHDVVGRQGDGARDGPRPRASSATSTSRSATTRATCASSPASTPTTSAARPRRSRRRTSSWRRSASCAGSSATSSPTARSTSPTTSSPSSTGCRRACTPASGSRATRAHEAGGRGAAAPGRPLPQPSEGADHQPPPGERPRPRAGVRGCARRRDGVEVNGLPDRLDLRDEHVRLAIEAGVPIVCSTDAHSMRGLGNMRLVGGDRAARLGDGRRRAQHAAAGGAIGSLARATVVVVLHVAGRIARRGRRSTSAEASRDAAAAPASRFSTGRSPSTVWSPRSKDLRRNRCLSLLMRFMSGGYRPACPLVDHSAGRTSASAERLDDAADRCAPR